MSLYVTFDADDLFFRPGKKFDSIEEAREFALKEGWRIYSVSKSPKKWVVDGTGFKPHYNYGLGKWIEDKGQYKRELKARKLVEVGNEGARTQTTPKQSGYVSDEVIKQVYDYGVSMSDTEIRELKGESNAV